MTYSGRKQFAEIAGAASFLLSSLPDHHCRGKVDFHVRASKQFSWLKPNGKTTVATSISPAS
jgi:hypothetical protein